MKIAMLYRLYARPANEEVAGESKELAPNLFVRVEIIDVPDADDLSAGLDHVHAREGEQFINCVHAEKQT